MSEILDKINKSIVEDFDNGLAKCFVMTAGTTLLNNGIKLWYTQRTLETKVEETEFGTVYKNSYAISFDGIDTSEHDAKVKADTIDEFIKKYIHYMQEKYGMTFDDEWKDLLYVANWIKEEK